MKKLIILSLIFLAACTKHQFIPPVQPVITDTVVAPINTNATYLYYGTVNAYSTALEALQYRTFGRSYYRDIPVIDKGLQVYNTTSTTNVFKGKNKWVALTANGSTWYAIRVNSNGIITDINTN